MEAEEPASGEGVAGSGGSFDPAVWEEEGGGAVRGAVGCGGDGAFDEVDDDRAADACVEEGLGGGFCGGPVEGAVGEPEVGAGDFTGFDFVEDEVVDPWEGAEGAAGEVRVFAADDIGGGDETGFGGGLEDVGGTAAAVGADGVEPVEEHEVAEVEETCGGGGEVEVFRGEEGIGAALVEERAAAGAFDGEGVGVAGAGEVGAVELGRVDLVGGEVVEDP